MTVIRLLAARPPTGGRRPSEIACRLGLAANALACVLVAVTVAGCSSSATNVGTSRSPVARYSEGLAPGHAPPQSTLPGLPPPEAAWDGPCVIYITTWGSGGYPELPSSVQVTGPDELTVRTHVDDLSHSDACASNLVADTSTIRVPTGIDPTRSVTIKIDGTTVNLAPLS